MIMDDILSALLCSKQKEEEKEVGMALPSFTRAGAEELGEQAVAERAAQSPCWRKLTLIRKGIRSFILEDQARASKVTLRTKLLLCRRIV
jgi:hypothetical protein